MEIRPKGPQAARIRQGKFELLRRFRIPPDWLPGSLSLTHRRCGQPTCHCAKDRKGHPVWSLTVDPWTTLRWDPVRVIRYRQYKPHGTVCEAYGLTDVPRHRVSSRSLLGMAKSRWEIEKQGFNDAKNRYGLEPICHQERHSLLAGWLLTCLALTIERLYRVRYLHRGTHPLRAAIDLLLQLQLSLGRPVVSALDSSGELASRAGGALRFSLLALLPQLSVAVSTHRGKMSLENTCRWAVPRRSALICAPSRNSAVPYAQIPKPLSPLRVS